MTENPNQPRQADGKFAGLEREPVEMDLTPVPQGSFLFPAILNDARETIAFFEHVEIGDEICMKVSSSYVASRQVTTRDSEQGWWDNVEKPYRERNGGDTSATAEVAYLAQVRSIWNSMPEYLDPRDARAAAKVIGMMSSSTSLDRAERDAVQGHPVATTSGPRSARDVYRDWGLSQFDGTIINPSTYDPEIKFRQFADDVQADVKAESERTREEMSRGLAETRQYVDNSLNQTGTAILSAM